MLTVPVKPEAALSVTMVPRGPLVGLAVIVGAVTVNCAEPTSGVVAESVISTVATPRAAVDGTVSTALESVPPGAAFEIVATLAPEASLRVMVTGPVRPPAPPETVTVVPLVPLTGLRVGLIVWLTAGPTALPRPLTWARPLDAGYVAAEAVVARGAAMSIGRVLSKSAPVNANAAKLLRSEFKVPSSSGRDNGLT
jgi:hypothetical protein